MKNIQLSFNYGECIGLDDIKKTEKVVGVKFPRSYEEIVLKYDGAYVVCKTRDGKEIDEVIDIPDRGKTTIRLKRHRVMENFSESQIVINFNSSREYLPTGFVPFAQDSGGNDFIFDFSENKNQPKIYFLHHEESITIDDLDEEDLEIMTLEQHQKDVLVYIANSFEEFIQKLLEV